MSLEPLGPEYVQHLFAPLHAELMALLRGLGPDDWNRPTLAPRWRVRDVAAHLLDGAVRKLAAHRDGHILATGRPPESYEDVVALINDLNASGVAWGNRLSTRMLADLIDLTGQWMNAFVESIDPHAEALFAVAWAGEARSENWMDTGREYTERWHHQAQIRDATGTFPLLDPKWLDPLLGFSVRALPRAYANVAAEKGSAVNFQVDTRSWSLVRGDAQWQLFAGMTPDAATTIRLGGDDAWRLLYNALSPDAARAAMQIDGDETLAAPLLRARSVMV